MPAIELASKYESDCRNCTGIVKIGDPVFFTPGVKGVVHKQCPDWTGGTPEIDVEALYKLEPPSTRPDFPSLFKHQSEVVNTLEKHPKSSLYLAWAPGAGKTLGSLASAQVSKNFPLIIVCPSVVKINWQREAKQWIGKDAQILSGQKPYEIDSDVIIINYDILSYWTDALKAVKAKGIVFDEAHYVKNPESKRTQAAREVAKSVDGMRFMLSGTPTPNSVYDLAMPLDMLGVLKHFGGHRRYTKRYCPPIQTRFGVSHAKAYNTKELHRNLVKSCFIRRRREDCLDLPEKIRADVPVTVNVQDDMEFYRPLLAEMKSGTITEARRVLSALPKGDMKNHMAKERAAAGTAKIDAIAELAADIDEPLVIMVHHKEVASELMKKLKKRKPVKLVGGMTAKARQASIDKFQNGETDVIVASLTAAGVGINLFRGTSMILGELPFTYAEIDQAESRCHRSGATNDLTVHRVIAVGTFDEAILNIIGRKEATSAAVEDGLDIEVARSEDIVAQKLVELYG